VGLWPLKIKKAPGVTPDAFVAIRAKENPLQALIGDQFFGARNDVGHILFTQCGIKRQGHLALSK
jgi:hypothetical protein